MNEREIISIFDKLSRNKGRGLVQGIGDDCAVFKTGGDELWLVTMDTLVESIHFNNDWHPPFKLGWKSVAVNVSDIAAMGGNPTYAFLSLALPPDFSRQWLAEFSRGLAAACREYDCFLAGGDTVRSSEGIMITLTVMGHAAEDKILYRSNALSGDDIWVSGTLGSAAAGLDLCKRGRVDDGSVAPLVEAHCAPKPRLDLARRLATSGLVNAMIDLSDGLASDLAHICNQSSAGAVIQADLLPISGMVRDVAVELGKDPLHLALAGGEDYELLFTAPARNRNEIVSLADTGLLTRIGNMEKRPGVRLSFGISGGKSLPPKDITFLGFDHFKE